MPSWLFSSVFKRFACRKNVLSTLTELHDLDNFDEDDEDDKDEYSVEHAYLFLLTIRRVRNLKHTKERDHIIFANHYSELEV